MPGDVYRRYMSSVLMKLFIPKWSEEWKWEMETEWELEEEEEEEEEGAIRDRKAAN